ncbi:hypothetical protein [Ascidiimonas aurantiaca]|uniref:hypothetical protein n=1 Tax=Ascidiimonas aurantiaca TaxID=1685432 RepID=UPI0030EF71A1
MRILTVFLLIIIFSSCKTDKGSKESAPEKPYTVPEKIARAHGFENWKNVKEIRFTFNVDRDTTHFERHWQWNTKANEVTMILAGDTISYSRNAIDSLAMKVDRGFINDKFWLLAPFNLMWDQGTQLDHIETTTAPISGKTMQKLTVTYPTEGGYTPGDAYDLYFEDDYLIKEWVFRKANTPEPSLITTWENHVNYNGILIATDRNKDESNWKLYFTDIEVFTK